MMLPNFENPAEAREWLRQNAPTLERTWLNDQEVWRGPEFISEGEGHSGKPAGETSRTVAVIVPLNSRYPEGPCAIVAGEEFELEL